MIKKIEGYIITLSVAIITIIMNINVILRYFFNSSYSPTEEICLSLLCIVVFVGTSYLSRTGEHLFASLIFDMRSINIRVKKYLALSISLIMCILSVFLAYFSIKYVYSTYLSGRVTPALGVPMYVIYLCIPYCFISIAIQMALTVFRNIKLEKAYCLGIDDEIKQ